MHHILELLSFQFIDNVVTFLLNSNTCIGNNTITAADVNRSMIKIDSIKDYNLRVKEIACSLGSSAGGKERKEGLVVEMSKVE